MQPRITVHRIGRPIRGSMLVLGSLAIACAGLVLASGPAGDRVEIHTKDARTITGKLIVEA